MAARPCALSLSLSLPCGEKMDMLHNKLKYKSNIHKYTEADSIVNSFARPHSVSTLSLSPPPPPPRLAKAEALAALVDGQEQLLPELVLALVLDQVELVEAGVGGGEAVQGAIGPVDLELLRA